MIAPVVIFVYNRFNHTVKTIESLSNNFLAKDTEVYIYSDGPKNDESKNDVEKVREYLETLKYKHGFKNLNVYYSDENNGLARSVIRGVTNVIDQYEKVIVVEDDLISSPNFLNFMNDALQFYKDKKVAWSICGYSFNLKIPKNYNHDIYFALRAGSWGWGTWSDRWNTVDWEVSDYEKFKTDKKLRRRFNAGGRDMSEMLDLQMAGRIDSWAIRWGYEQFKQGKLTVFPVESKIKNVGLDGSGTHSGKTSRFDVKLDVSGKRNFKFINPYFDKQIIRNFKNYYSPPLKFYLTKILKIIRKVKG